VQEAWNPVCPDCGGFDTLTWRDAPVSRAPAGAEPALAPLLFDRPAPPPPPPEAEVLPDPEPEPEPAPALPVLSPDEILRRAT
jgi:HemY protein